jgi:site-specific DNA-methyltransferase (adenine-specific)
MTDYINTIINGNNIDVLKTFPDNCIDGIVTDPPYELNFMCKKWDNSGIAYSVELWSECLRVLKPGGYLLAFSATRTYHRMTVAIEDAGFEIRDMLEWIYYSGFPKSLNVGKAYDKLMGNEREVVEIEGKKKSALCWAENYGNRKEIDVTKGNSPFEGFGTATKPAHEPICMARKPLSEKTVINNVIKWGTGAINIDGCRIPTIKETEPRKKWEEPSGKYIGYCGGNKKEWIGFGNKIKNKPISEYADLGRFPSNILCTDDALNDGSVTTSSGGNGSKYKNSLWKLTKNSPIKDGDYGLGLGDSGSNSRYFNIDVWAEKHGLLQFPKASQSERNLGCEGLEKKENELIGQLNNSIRENGTIRTTPQPKANHHPTVKPYYLLAYLIRLISKENDVILDPFMGSGSTAIAAKRINRKFIGIELEPEYITIANERIKAIQEVLL